MARRTSDRTEHPIRRLKPGAGARLDLRKPGTRYGRNRNLRRPLLEARCIVNAMRPGVGQCEESISEHPPVGVISGQTGLKSVVLFVRYVLKCVEVAEAVRGIEAVFDVKKTAGGSRQDWVLVHQRRKFVSVASHVG